MTVLLLVVGWTNVSAARPARAENLMRPEAAPAGSLLPTPLPWPVAGDWVIFGIREETREYDLALRYVGRDAQQLEFAVFFPGQPRSAVRRLVLPAQAWTWESIPDLLIEAMGRRPKLSRQRFSFRSDQESIHAQALSHPAPASGTGPPLGQQAPAQRLNAAGLEGAASRWKGRGARLRLEAEWRGRDPSLGGLELRRQATLISEQPSGPLGGVTQVLIEEWLVLPEGPSLREQIWVEQLRQGNGAAWPAEQRRKPGR